MSRQVQAEAGKLSASRWPFTKGTQTEYEKFDLFLRADGHRRNPGTTADMIAAILFVAFRENMCSFDSSARELVFSDRQYD